MQTYYDLLRHYPTHFVDRSKVYRIADFEGDMPCVQVRGHFVSLTTQGEGAKLRLVGLFTDGSRTMEIVWFRNIRSLKNAYKPGATYAVFGKPVLFNGHWSMSHPEIDAAGTVLSEAGMRGVYPLTDGLRRRNITSRTIYTWICSVLDSAGHIAETLPSEIVEQYNLMSLHDALHNAHRPQSVDALNRAKMRLKFEELFFIQVDMLRQSRQRKYSLKGLQFSKIGHYFNSFYNTCLPFPLTGAQKRVIREIRSDVNTGRQMNRLVQGDVGSGKTIVALMAMLMALDNGSQACLMAPTEILATQHFESLANLVEPIGVNIALLTGNTPQKRRREIHEQLLDGSLHILVGTHAVIEDTVRFNKLGIVVIDEQHRFGVAQRGRLWNKNINSTAEDVGVPPHVLVMTATPIPRTLAMTVYGDLDVSVIDELPPGRKPVTTLLRYDDQRLATYKSVYRQLEQGRQVYIVYPLVKENEKLDLRSLEYGYDHIRETFPAYKVAFVHGQMRPEEKEHQMELFVTHKADILVATTVIEVGVNVPNASVMIIENAERFGLSQLHQLRGRVGRGAAQSYCILMTKRKIATETRRRLEIMTSTTDGFIIAEADMRMRGPGDIEGTMQSGIPFQLRAANLATDGEIIALARKAAEQLLDSDPTLSHPSHAAFVRELSFVRTETAVDWSRIS